jgi:colanic acid biosynthesis glycosyl transferase WcaI
MRILLLNQFFHPDSAATSQFLTDLARALADRGHQVTVICGTSQYASQETSTPPHVRTLRSKPIPFGRGRATRIASYATFLSNAALRTVFGPAHDVVLTLTTPPLLSLVGTLGKALRGSRCFIWEMDLYPDIAIDLGVFCRSSLVTRIVGAFADYSRRKADGIVALGEDMRERLIARRIPEHKIHVAQNWADGREIHPLPFPPPPLTLYYSGNLGLAHEIRTIRTAMLALRTDLRFRFIFAGGGPQRDELRAFCDANAISNTDFLPYCNRSQLGESLAQGHIGLVTQKAETAGSVVPSKVYGIMASGRPILYIGPAHTTPARIIERFGCGWHIPPGDVEGVVSLLSRLSAIPDEIPMRGERARRAFRENFDLPLGTARIAAILSGYEFPSQLEEIDSIPVARPLTHSASTS